MWCIKASYPPSISFPVLYYAISILTVPLRPPYQLLLPWLSPFSFLALRPQTARNTHTPTHIYISVWFHISLSLLLLNMNVKCHCFPLYTSLSIRVCLLGLSGRICLHASQEHPRCVYLWHLVLLLLLQCVCSSWILSIFDGRKSVCSLRLNPYSNTHYIVWAQVTDKATEFLHLRNLPSV